MIAGKLWGVLAVGDAFGRYVIEALLGEGGMGRVYRAKDTVLGRAVALKILRAERTDAAARVVREARAVAALGHPNVVAVFDAGEEDGVAYLAMEYLDGETLRAYVGDAAIPVNDRLRWVTDVARALAAAHASGIVHRDVKPENVIVLRDGTVKVLDFGIARRAPRDPGEPREADAAAIATLTTTGGIVGTPRYMAPEQMLGDPVDGRADQFAWGVLAYELFTGSSPWGDADEAVQVVARVLSPSRAPMATRDGLPPGLAAIVEHAIARDPEDRFPSMRDVVAALEAVAAGEPLVLPPARGRRRRFATALAGVAVALAALGWLARARFTAAPAIAPSASAATRASDTGVADAGAHTGANVGACDVTKPFGSPIAVAGLESTGNDQALRLSPDYLTGWFMSDRAGAAGAYDLFLATRSSVTSPFSNITKLSSVSSTSIDAAPTVPRDGSRMIFGSWRPPGPPSRLYMATRSSAGAAFGHVTPMTSLNTGNWDQDPFLREDGQVLYWDRGAIGEADIYRSLWNGTSFGPPAPVTELESSTEDWLPTVTPDDLTIYWSSKRTDGSPKGGHDIWTATRASTSQPFSGLKDVPELNTPGDDFPTFITRDGCTLYYVVGPVVGKSQIYVATRGR